MKSCDPKIWAKGVQYSAEAAAGGGSPNLGGLPAGRCGLTGVLPILPKLFGRLGLAAQLGSRDPLGLLPEFALSFT